MGVGEAGRGARGPPGGLHSTHLALTCFCILLLCTLSSLHLQILSSRSTVWGLCKPQTCLSLSLLNAPSEFIQLLSFPDPCILVKLVGSDHARWHGLTSTSSDSVAEMLLRASSMAVLHVHDPHETFLLDLSSRESLFFSATNDFPYRKYKLLSSFHVILVALAFRKLIVQHIQTHILYL